MGLEYPALKIFCEVRAGGEGGFAFRHAGQGGGDGGNNAAGSAILAAGVGMIRNSHEERCD